MSPRTCRREWDNYNMQTHFKMTPGLPYFTPCIVLSNTKEETLPPLVVGPQVTKLAPALPTWLGT